MSKKATEFQKREMSKMYRGKEIFKPLNTGWVDERVACVREWVANIFFYQVSGDYMRWIGYFFIFMGIKMATDGVLRGLGIMRPFLVANMVNLAIRLSVALICAPRFGIAFVWLAVPVGWLANFLISYVALRRSWSTDKMASIR